MRELFDSGYFALFLIISIGIIIGKFRVKGFSLDVSAVIFVALLMGHLGYIVPVEFQTLGLVLFIFTVGMQSGPGFFDAFMKWGRQLVVICSILIASAFGLSVLFGKWWNIDSDLMVGVFNGALTSTPGLAAAIDATSSPKAAVGYGLAYPAGVILVILFMQFMPVILKIKLKDAEDEYEAGVRDEHPEIQTRHLVVKHKDAIGRSLQEIGLRQLSGAVASRIKHNDEIYVPCAQTVLEEGDILKIAGTAESLAKAAKILGEFTDEEIIFRESHMVNWVLVTNKAVVNKSLGKLNLPSTYNATITRIRRSGIDLRPHPSLRLRFGDKILIASPAGEMNALMRLMGNDEKRLSETNFLPISLGILIGMVIGSLSIPVFGFFNFSLGITGGVLTSSLILSRIGKTGPIIWSMSGSGNQLIRRLGLLLFLASVGTGAGGMIAGVIADLGWKPIAAGMIITVLPMILALLFGKWLMKINILTLMGVISGAMTSTPGLAALDGKTESDAPAVGYATVYPIALVLMIILSQLMAILL